MWQRHVPLAYTFSDRHSVQVAACRRLRAASHVSLQLYRRLRRCTSVLRFPDTRFLAFFLSNSPASHYEEISLQVFHLDTFTPSVPSMTVSAHNPPSPQSHRIQLEWKDMPFLLPLPYPDVPRGSSCYTLKTEAWNAFETPIRYNQTTRRHIATDGKLLYSYEA